MGGMKANRFMSLLDVISVRWQTEVKEVGSHIAPCVPASVKSGGLAWRTEYLRTEGNSRLWRLRQQSLKQEARCFSRGRRSRATPLGEQRPLQGTTRWATSILRLCPGFIVSEISNGSNEYYYVNS